MNLIAGCPNCGGTLRLDEDRYGRRLACYNCWWQHDEAQESPEQLAFMVEVVKHGGKHGPYHQADGQKGQRGNDQPAHVNVRGWK